MAPEQLNIPMQKTWTLIHTLDHMQKFTSTFYWIIEINIKLKTIHLPEENIERYFLCSLAKQRYF